MNHELLNLSLAMIVVATRSVHAPHTPWWGRLIRKFLVVTFPIGQHIMFDLQVSGRPNLTNPDGTLVVANHKTDFDIIILGPKLYRARNGTGKGIAFVAAERMFLPGYLSEYILHRPQWLRRLIYPANLSAVLKAIRAYPIGYLHGRKLKAHLRTVLEMIGNIPVGDLFSRPLQEMIPGVKATTHISGVLRFRYHRALDQEREFSVFAPEIRRKLRTQHVRETLAALARFAAVLDEGDPLYIAPEGGLEKDGKFKEAKAGLIRIIKMARNPNVLPMNITYDFMTTGRQRAFLTIGKQLHRVKELPGLEKKVINAVSRLGTITFSQLAAVGMWTLAARGQLIHAGALKQAIIQTALRLASEGYHVDMHILTAKKFAKRWRRFISYCKRNQMLDTVGAWILFDPNKLFQPAEDGSVPPWTYAMNEFESIVDATKTAILMEAEQEAPVP